MFCHNMIFKTWSLVRLLQMAGLLVSIWIVINSHSNRPLMSPMAKINTVCWLMWIEPRGNRNRNATIMATKKVNPPLQIGAHIHCTHIPTCSDYPDDCCRPKRRTSVARTVRRLRRTTAATSSSTSFLCYTRYEE